MSSVNNIKWAMHIPVYRMVGARLLSIGVGLAVALSSLAFKKVCIPALIPEACKYAKQAFGVQKPTAPARHDALRRTAPGAGCAAGHGVADMGGLEAGLEEDYPGEVCRFEG